MLPPPPPQTPSFTSQPSLLECCQKSPSLRAFQDLTPKSQRHKCTTTCTPVGDSVSWSPCPPALQHQLPRALVPTACGAGGPALAAPPPGLSRAPRGQGRCSKLFLHGVSLAVRQILGERLERTRLIEPQNIIIKKKKGFLHKTQVPFFPSSSLMEILDVAGFPTPLERFP